MKIIMRPLFNQENKMRLINQQLYKRRKIALKKLRIQQQQQQRPITININTGFETNQRIKEIYKKLELLAPQEIEPSVNDPISRMLENEREQAERMEKMRADDEAQEQIDLAEEERQNDIAVAEEEKQMKIEEDEERGEMMGKEEVNVKKTKTLTPRELRLNAALKRQKLLNRSKEKDKRINLKELVLMNLNDKRINSLLNDKITNSLFG